MEATWVDDIVVGGGILGLATAWHLRRLGRSVRVLERGHRAQGASIRNFGMLWPVGQPPGERLETALRSRAFWLEALAEAGIWHEPRGSLHAVYHPIEEQMLREFAAGADERGYEVSLLTADEALERSPRLRSEGLLGAIFSATEVCVDPRLAVAGLTHYLQENGVDFWFQTAATAVSDGVVEAGGLTHRASQVWICTGDEVSGLFAPQIKALGLVACKLQMMRTAPVEGGERIGPMLAAGLTLAHYGSFAHCPSLPALRASLAERHPGYAERGIHVMVSQTPAGELTIGDSHEYGSVIDPFNKVEIDAMILDYLDSYFDLRGTKVVSQWSGIYAKHPTEAWTVLHPEPTAHIITGVGGAGMTLSFGVTDRVVREVLGG